MSKNSLVRTAIVSLGLLAGAAVQAQSYSNAVAALSPVAYWPLAETAQPPAQYIATNSGTLGAVGNGYYETWYQAMGGTTLIPTNVIQHPAGVTVDGDTALQNSIVGQHVVIPRATNGVANAAVTLKPPFSIEVWVFPTNGSAAGGIKPLVSEGFVNSLNGPSLGNLAVSQGVTIGSFNNIIYFSTFNGAGTKTEIDTAAYAANAWHHIVGTFDGTTMRMYDNGIPLTTKNPPADALGRTFAPDLVTPLLIGSGGNQNSTFGGIIDEVAIYTNVLSATDVTNHLQTAYGTNATYAANYRNAVLANNPLMYFRLDEPAFTSAPALNTCPVANNYGSLGSTANGFYQPGTTPGIAGPSYSGFGGSSHAVALDGFNAGIDVPLGGLPSQLNPTGTQPMTVMTWFRANPADCVGRFQEIAGHSDLGWRLGLDFTAGNRFNPGNGPELLFTGGVAEEVATGMFLNDGNWHFVAGVSDGTSDYLYLDGILVKSGTPVNNIAGTNLDVILGGDPQYTAPTLGPSGSRYFDGNIAHVAFFTNALTAGQIQGIFSAAGVPPVVRVQPLSQGVFAGQTVTLTPTISGSTPMTFQWYKNGSAISGQTGASLSFNPIGTGDTGSYYLAATNSYGGTTTTVAQITVETATTYSSAVKALNPVGYWLLDETTQPPFGAYVATNLGTLGVAGNGFYQTWFQKYSAGITNLYYQTNSVTHTNGAIGDGDQALFCARSAAGAGSYVVFPHATNGVANPAITLVPPFSIEFWVNPGGTVGSVQPIVNEGRMPVLDPRNGYTTTNEDGFSVGQFGGNVFFATYNGTGGDSTKQELDVAITAGVWQHMVITFDGTNQVWFKNGVQAANRSIPSTAANPYGQLFMPDSTTPLLIGTGSELSAGNGATEYSGAIDEVAIYTTVLDSTSIANHYSAASASDSSYKNAVLANNPAIYVRLGEPAFNSYPSPSTFPVAKNYGSLGGPGNGVYQPGTVAGVRGPNFAGFGGSSRAVAVNGFSGGVDVGGGYVPAALNPTGTQPLSFTAWFQGNPADAPARFQAIASHGNNSYRLAVDATAGGARFNPGSNPSDLQFTNNSDIIANNSIVNDGAWHFIAGVSDGTTASMYVDGVLTKTAAVTAVTGSTADILLGGDPDNLTPNFNTANTIRYFDGQVAQVALFTNALSQGQIQQLYGAAGVPPSIVVQPPASVTGTSGYPIAVSIAAKGSSLAYQWYRTNGTAVAGQTTSSLTFNPVQLNNANSYYVIVTNSWGSATSTVVQLSVLGAPVVQQQSPTDVRVFVGTSPTLHVTANGSPPISYQWTKDGSAISGATGTRYQPSTVSTGTHSYGCTITNIYSTNTPSAFSTITVQVTNDPTAPFPVQVLADHPQDYFRLNEPEQGGGNNGLPAYDYAGGLNASYTNTTLGQPGYTSGFTVQTDPETSALFGGANSFAGNVSSYLNFGTTNGSSAAFSIEAWISAYAQNTNAGIVSLGYGNGGEQFCLDTGGGGFSYRFFVRDASGAAHGATAAFGPNGAWHHLAAVCDEPNGHVYLYVDGTNVASGTITANSGLLSSSLPLTIGSRMEGQGTGFDSQFNGSINDVAIYNYALSASNVLSHYLAAGIAPIVTLAPTNTTVNQGSTATFYGAAIGTAPLHYQWADLSTGDLPGQTNATLVLNNVPLSDDGHFYTLTITNLYGSTTTYPAMLSVLEGPPQINVDVQPLFAENYVGTPFTYSVTVQGTAPLHYQWTRNGSNIAGATNSSYSFNTLLGTNFYAVTVTNNVAPYTATSSTATNVGVAAPTLNPTDYSYRAKISFPGYNKTETLSDFPALVQFGTNLPGFDYSQMASLTGGDVRFTDASGGRVLWHEVDEWNPTGQSFVWVQIPRLAGTNDPNYANNYIWAYWGSAANATPPAYATNGSVWVPQSFEGLPAYEVVYHLKEGALPFADSTTGHSAINGTAPAAAAGTVGTGGTFLSGTYLDAGAFDMGDAFTLSAWVDVNNGATDIQTIWANQVGGFGNAGFAFGINTYQASNQKIYLASGIGNSTGSEATTATGTVGFGQWHLLTAAMVRTNPASVQFYLDAVPVPLAGGFMQNGFTNNADLNLGRFLGGSFSMHGLMDEARVQQGAASPNWVFADYMTVAANTTFQSYGAVVSSIPTLNVQLIGNHLILSGTGPAGTNFYMLAATNVTQLLATWPRIATNTFSSNGTYSITNTLDGTKPRQFYRVSIPR